MSTNYGEIEMINPARFLGLREHVRDDGHTECFAIYHPAPATALERVDDEDGVSPPVTERPN